MHSLLDAIDRETLVKRILKKDQELSKKFAFYGGDLLSIDRYKNSMMFLNFSANGLVWLAGLIAFSYLVIKDSLIEMEVNLLMALILDIIVVAVIKAFIRRERPIYDKDAFKMGPNISSFPSGCSARSTLLFLFFTVLSPIHKILWLPLYAWWFSICFTRVLLRKHHILDVLGGILLGLMEGIIISYFWVEQESARNIFNWILDEKIAGSDADEVL